MLLISILLLSTSAWAATLWEPGKVVAVEQVSTPEKTPDPSCRSLPRGSTPPPQCRPANLRAEQFWRVTIDVGNKRFVVRPYRTQKSFAAETVYVDPNLTVAQSVEVTLSSNKTIHLRTDQSQGIPAIIDSQELQSSPSLPKPAAPVTTASKVVLLENGDFHDMEVQEFKSQDIGDGVALYSFTGDVSQARIASNPPIFLVLAHKGNIELSRLQVGKETRQLAHSKTRSASSLPVTVTQMSDTIQKVTVKEPLPAGEYAVLLENSPRGYLFHVP